MQEHPRPRQFLAITFALRDGLYALEQRGAATLLPWLQRYMVPSEAPGLPGWCLGLINVRGTVQMVADTGQLLGLGPSAVGDESRLIFIEQHAAQLGLLVDREIGVRMLRLADTSPDPIAGDFVACAALLDDQQVLVLDGARIIAFAADVLRAPAYL